MCCCFLYKWSGEEFEEWAQVVLVDLHADAADVPTDIVEIGAGGHDQAVARGDRAVPGNLRRRVRAVKNFDPLQTAHREVIDDRVVLEPTRMREHRHAAAARDHIDRLIRRYIKRGLVAGTAA